ncbi:hypothetical protein ACHAWF_011767 [Thalassiosira exigua]
MTTSVGPLVSIGILFLGLLHAPTCAHAFVSPRPASERISPGTAQTEPWRRPRSSLQLAGFEEAWSSYLSALEADPLLVKSVTAGVILGAADLSGQAIQQAIAASDADGDESASGGGGVDFARFARFAFFGFVLQAPWNHFYYLLLDGALPPTEDPLTATTGIKVVIDQFIQAPIFTVLIFGFLGFLEGKTTEEIKQQLDEDYVDTMLANWKLWVPATAVNIAFCPPILRVLFLNVVFFFWSIFLSLKLNKAEEVVEEI